MIAAPAGAQIWIAAGVTDLRRGFMGLSALVQTGLEQDPFAGHVFVFRGRRAREDSRGQHELDCTLGTIRNSSP